MLSGYKVKDVLMKEYKTVDAGETVKTAVQMLLNGQCKSFLVTENNNPVGTLSRDEIIKALSKKDDNEIIHSVMNRNLIILKPFVRLPRQVLYLFLTQRPNFTLSQCDNRIPIPLGVNLP